MSAAPTSGLTSIAAVQHRLDQRIEDLLGSLPAIERLSATECRGMIARYASVLEGNFIYWMTGAYLSVKSDEAHSIILENLHEEVRDCHPGMLRRFAIAAKSVPTDTDAAAVYEDLMNVRLFVGRLQAVPLVVMMAFFEGFIQRFMAYLEDLARRLGSAEREYTEVHGVCDVTHTRELYRALQTEQDLANGSGEHVDVFEGVDLLDKLIRKIVTG
jgi:Iron-containing redox enzyme